VAFDISKYLGHSSPISDVVQDTGLSEELLSLVELTGEVLVDSTSQEMVASTVTRIMSFFLAVCLAAALGSPPLEKHGPGLLQ